MSVRRRLSFTAALLVLVIGIVGCSRPMEPPPPPPPAPPAPAPEPPPPPPPPPPPSPPPAPLTEDEIFAMKSLAELNAEMPMGPAFFDYDMSALRDDAIAVLQANAQYMMRWPSVRVTVEGHADERGTNEYNLALGDRRAGSVRDYLASLGVAEDRVLAVTRGEESPFCSESNEACWQQNRRGHFVITAK